MQSALHWGGGGSSQPRPMCSIHLDDAMAAILRQNAHHTSAYWWRGDRLMKPISVWGWLGSHDGQRPMGKFGQDAGGYRAPPASLTNTSSNSNIVFPGGLPSRYWPDSTLLSFSGQPVLGCRVIWLLSPCSPRLFTLVLWSPWSTGEKLNGTFSPGSLSLHTVIFNTNLKLQIKRHMDTASTQLVSWCIFCKLRVNPISLSYPFLFHYPFVLPLSLVPWNRVVTARGEKSPMKWDATWLLLRHHTSSLAGCYVTRGDKCWSQTCHYKCVYVDCVVLVMFSLVK